MTYLVTGARGLLGKPLVDALSQMGHSVIATARCRPAEETRPGVTWIEADLATFTGWESVLGPVEVVYHLAWSSLPHTANAAPADDAAVNILGTVRLLESLRAKPGTRFVFASSGGTVYGPPTCLPISEDHPTLPISAYGVSKLAVESYLNFFAEAHGLNPISLRVSNLFGPDQNISRQFGDVSTFSAAAVEGGPITIFGDGGTVRDYIFISDAISAFIAAGHVRQTSRAVNIGTGQGHSLTEILSIIGDLNGGALDIRHRDARAFDVRCSVLDVSRAATELGWHAVVPFEVGVESTYAGIRARLGNRRQPAHISEPKTVQG